jgi:hypothetical protein
VVVVGAVEVVVELESGNTAIRRTDEQVVAIAAKISRVTGATSTYKVNVEEE